MSLLEELPHSVDLTHVTYAQSDLAGDSETDDDTPYADDEPAWVQPASASEIKAFAQRNQTVTHKVYLLRNPGLVLSDRMLVNSGPYADETMNVRSFRECTAGLDGVDDREGAWLVMVQSDRES